MTLDGSGTDLVSGSDLDNEAGGGGLGTSLSSQWRKTCRCSLPDTQEWSDEIRPQIIFSSSSICDKHMPCLTPLVHTSSSIYQSSLAFLFGCYLLRTPWTIRKSRSPFSKGTLKKPKQPVALARILNKRCRRKCCMMRTANCQLVVSGQNRILSLCPSSAQSPCSNASDDSVLPSASMLR